MSIFYDLILEMKYGLQDNQIIHINTIDGETILIRPHNRIDCFDGIMVISKKETVCKIVNLHYVTSVELYNRGAPEC